MNEFLILSTVTFRKSGISTSENDLYDEISYLQKDIMLAIPL